MDFVTLEGLAQVTVLHKVIYRHVKVSCNAETEIY